DMSRYVFAGIQTELVPLARELEFAKDYLEIEKVRFGRRLQAELPDATCAEGLTIPALTLQPLIENAVSHGIARIVSGGVIFVRLHRNGSRFSLTVENEVEDSARPTEHDFFRPGHAVHNIRQRLHLAYGGNASIQVAI